MPKVKKEKATSSKSNKRNREEEDGDDEVGVNGGGNKRNRESRCKNLEINSNSGNRVDDAGRESREVGDGERRVNKRGREERVEEEEGVSKRGRVERVEEEEEEEDEVVARRNLRSKYNVVKNLIGGEDEGCTTPDPEKFRMIFNKVESLHKQVRKPREQVADAEALLDITTSFVKSVKAQRNEGATPADFVSCLLRTFGRQERAASSSADGPRSLIRWKDIGLEVSHIFRKAPGCFTMLGPMDSELKIRKTSIRKRHVKPTGMARPEELNNGAEEKTDTDKNMSTMFDILRKHRRVRLENLVLNRTSFSQTVENLFAMSFLVKDGRAEIFIKENVHFLCPRNAPDAKAVESGKVSYNHFVFRFDFRDWKLMSDTVKEGEELMPHRYQVFDVRASASSQENSTPVEPEPRTSTTPIRTLSRNRGLVLLEQIVVDESPESDENIPRASYIRKGKRKLIA